MQPMRTFTGRACPLPFAGIDTDQLLPARFMTRSRAEGYGECLLYDLRHAADGAEKAEFPLNKPVFSNPRIIVARRNFGGGSSREAAVYALCDFGIRCVIAPSFGDIFASNSVNNGLLPATVSDEDAERLLTRLDSLSTEMTIDLERCMIILADLEVAFTIADVWRSKLLNGWDDIDLTLTHRDRIDQFAARDAIQRPWATPHRPL